MLLRRKRVILVGAGILGGGLPIPAAPTLTAPADSVVLDDTTPDFSWSIVLGAALYRIQISTVSNFASTVVDDATLATNSYTPGSALDISLTYYWRVAGINAGGVQGAWSSTRTFAYTLADTFVRDNGAIGGSWLGAGTAAISSNLAILTPTIASNLLTNGGFEDWPNPANAPTGWSRSVAGTSTVNREETTKHAGNYAARLDIDGSGSNAQLAIGGMTVGKFYRYLTWTKTSNGNYGVNIGSAISPGFLLPDAADLTQNESAGLALHGSFIFQRNSSSGINTSYYGDDFDIGEITTNTMLRVIKFAATTTFSAKVMLRPYGGLGGLIARLDDYTNPQNFIAAYVAWRGSSGGTGGLRVIKCVNGTCSQLFGGAVTTITTAGPKKLEIRNTAANTYEVWYNESLITTQTVSDASIASNQYAGLISSSPNCQFGGIFGGFWYHAPYEVSAPIVMDGDSLTAGTPPNAVGHITPNLSAPVPTFWNTAVGGRDIETILSSAAAAVDIHLTAGQKNVIWMWGGINNMYASDVASSQPAYVYGKIKDYWLARQAAATAAGVTNRLFIACTLTPSAHVNTDPTYETRRLEINTLIRNGYQSDFGCDVLVDVGGDSILGLEATASDTTWYSDGLHHTDLAKSRIANLIAPYIRSYLGY